MRLTDLIEDGPTTVPAIEIAGLAADSREVAPGFLFAALPGTRADGRAFIAEALARGAAAVLADPAVRPEEAKGAALVTDANPRRRLALMAARFYGAQPRIAAAVTGTNGKTSVAAFTRQIWAALGHRAASLGTLGLTAPGFAAGPALTTPDPVTLHRNLARLAEVGIARVVMEASSHGLAQFRLDGVRLGVGAFTNLTRDHIDYHGSEDAYRDAKLRLFAELLPAGATAVLNADAADFAAFAAAARSRGLSCLTFGVRGEDIRLLARHAHAAGQHLELALFGARAEIDLPLVGDFQASNALCALAIVIACGDPPAEALAALARLEGAPGRLQHVARHPNGAAILVDYAHTPDALATVLAAVRPHVAGRLVVVFGCGGDRDPGKRPMMGEIAARAADRAIVTDDNPRSEDPAAIRAAILAACPGAHEIGDRGEAIRVAIAALAPGDALVVAGKGHETGQIIGAEVRPFDDAETVRAVVAALGGGRA